jgi:site-specific DNA recombinase
MNLQILHCNNTQVTMEKAILYTRVSTDEQAEKGYSLADQKDKLLKYCKERNIEVAATFVENFSAKSFNRPEFNRLLKFIRLNKGKIKYLLFHKWDRFSRKCNRFFHNDQAVGKIADRALCN